MSLASSSNTAATNICTSLGVSDTASINQWKHIMSQIATWIEGNGTVTIAPSSIVTTGSATTQTGPAAPIILAIS